MDGIRNHSLIGLDTNIFIYHFEENKKFVVYTQQIFEKLIHNKLKSVTSVVSIIEALSYPSPKEVLQGIEEGFKTLPNVTVLDVNRDIALIAASIRRKYGFRLPDATQLATSVYAKADVFISNDQRFKQFKEMPVVLLEEPLFISVDKQ